MKVCGVEFCPKIFSRIHGIWLRYYVWECKTIISRGPPSKNEAYSSGKRTFFEKVTPTDFKQNQAILSYICCMKVCGVEFCPKIFSRIHGIWLRYYVWECKTIISRGPPIKNEAYSSGKHDLSYFW